MAAWHPLGVHSFTSGPVLEGSSAIRAWLERAWAGYAEVYHCRPRRYATKITRVLSALLRFDNRRASTAGHVV
jgi:hypothetical protein